MFGHDGQVMQPSEYLYKKNVLVLRGRFRQVTHVNVDMLLTSRRHFRQDPEVDKNKIEMLTELTLSLPLLVFFTNKHEYKWKDL